MGKAIDAIYDAMLELEKDGSKLLDENFMSNIFSKIDTDEDGNEGPDVDLLDKRRQNEKQTIIKGGEKLRDEFEDNGQVDRYEKMQPPRLEVDETLIGARIEQLWEYSETDSTTVKPWCKGVVVAVKKNSRVHIQWGASCVWDGGPKITQEKLLKTKWNKHVEEAWRMNIPAVVVKVDS